MANEMKSPHLAGSSRSDIILIAGSKAASEGTVTAPLAQNNMALG
jgi:hypothetical protein